MHFRQRLAGLSPVAQIWKEALAALTQAHGPIPKEIRVKFTGETAAKFYGLDVPAEPMAI